MHKLHALPLSAQYLLHAVQPPDLALTCLLPAAHLTADLQIKLHTILVKSRRPAAFGGASQPVTTGLEGCSIDSLYARLQPFLPALQQHLSMAVATIRRSAEGLGREALYTGGGSA